MLTELFKLFWKNVERNDAKRIKSQTSPTGIAQFCDIQYIDDGSWQHRLDVYCKSDNFTCRPIIIDIHGGGWMYGTKEINKNYCLVLAQNDYVVVNINYRLAPEVSVADQLRDCFFAFKWVSSNIEKYGGDLNNVYVTGDSAGGFLAAYSALLNSSEKLRKIFGVTESGLEFSACALTSPVCFMNTHTFQDVYFGRVKGKEFSEKPLCGFENFDAVLNMGTMPPTFLVTSSGDTVGRLPTIKMYNLLCGVGVKCKLENREKYNGKHLPHVFSVIDPFSVPAKETISDMLGFFSDYVKTVQ